MYAREVEGKILTFSVSGLLWDSSLLMRDQETGSLWSHILGEAREGPLKGKRLEQVPSVMTDWESWRKQHPDGSVVLLDRSTQAYTRAFYAEPAQFVLGIAVDGKAPAWGFDFLAKEPALNERLGDKPVLVAFDRDSVTARMYERSLQDKTLTFHVKEGRLMDNETGSTWDPGTGWAVAGPLEGSYLTAMPAIVSYRNVWEKFHPKSKIYSSGW